jgi:hypothetical protein
MFRTLFINFPIFNIADIFITLGFATFCIHFISLSFKAGRSTGDTVDASSDDYFDEFDDEQTDPDEQRETDYIELPDIDAAVSPQPEPAQEASEPQATMAPQVVKTPQVEPDAVSSVIYEPVSEHLPMQQVVSDLSFTLEALDALEAELESVEDYNVDDLLREYGFEDENDDK